MTKKPAEKATQKQQKKKSSKKGSTSLVSVIVIIGIVIFAFIGNQLGIIDSATFEEILQTVTEEEVIAEAPPQPGEGEVSFATPTAHPSSPTGSSTDPVNPDEWYQVYFTSPQFPDEPTTRNDIIIQALLSLINSAQSTLDIAIYELNLDEIGEAILAARERGVKVRLVTDTDELEALETLIWLEEEGIRIVSDDRNALMHNKFVVVDGQKVWTGSWNFTTNGTFRNDNHAILIYSTELAANYSAEFEEMFIEQEFGPTSSINTLNPFIIIDNTLIETCFAPEDKCGDQLVSLIRQAKESIRFMAFSFTHDEISKIVRARARDGIVVEGIFETRGSDTSSSEYNRMRRLKLDVLRDGNPYTLHHKVIIIDDETVVLGSFNFSDNADTANDENMLIIHDTRLAGQFLVEFGRVYDQALQNQ